MPADENELARSRRELEKIVEDTVSKQVDWVRESTLGQIDVTRTFLTAFQKLTQFAMFKTNVQRGGRISIPEAERQTVGIEEGMPVQVIIFPIEKKVKEDEE